MSTLLGDVCSFCKHSMSITDETPMGRCKAFPTGIPGKHRLMMNTVLLDECSNGYKYEYDESKDYLKDID